MQDNRRSVYWDASVWLSYINENPDRLPTLEAILADSSKPDGTIRLYTSVISQVEVAFTVSEQAGGILDPEAEQKIDRLWADRNVLDLIEVHQEIYTEARTLIRVAMTNGWSLRGMDALHLATAKWFGVDEIHTYDQKWKQYEAVVGIRILEPYIPQPRMPGV